MLRLGPVVIDWITAKVKWKDSDLHGFWEVFCARRWPGWQRLEVGGEVTGVKWDFRRLRSDSREVTVMPAGDGFTVCGSPASAMGASDNVFGSSDPQECLEALLSCAFEVLASDGWSWGREWVESVKVSRVDVTFNVLLPSEAHVAGLLRGIDGIETGRYRTGRKYGTTVYLGGKSRRLKSKVYNKGAHYRRMVNRGQFPGVTPADLALLDRVARLEVEFGRDFWREHGWHGTKDSLEERATEYWSKLWGEVGEVVMGSSEVERLVEVADGNARLARAAWRTLSLIRSQGREAAELSVSRATWFRHQRLLRAAGYGEADLHGGALIYRFPVREVLACRVDTWEELRRAA